jgi:hypothetical protein
MSEHYHDVSDLRLLKEMGKLAPTEFNAWLNLDKIVGREDGAIPRKYRELYRLGCSFDDPMPVLHRGTHKGRQNSGRVSRGNTESTFIAAVLRAGGAATHGTMALKFYDRY